jgi:BirA family biotin operon repressor/biotin-[acetyl-CoA-carboxylase] ligase
MDIRNQIIRHLADGKFHSGEELASRFEISRAAIWKHLSHIRDEMGMEVFAVKGRGYRLADGIEFLDGVLIESLICDESRSLLSSLQVHERISSTNDHLMGEDAASFASGTVCFAEQQTNGRGRRGREWVSPYGSNLYLSILWNYPLAPADLSGLSLAAGIAVARSLEVFGIQGVGLKWPNDLLWENRKLAGLLLEVSGEYSGPSRVVLGLGLNTRLHEHQGAEIDQPWVDLQSLPGGDNVGRNELAARIVSNLLKTLYRFETQGLTPDIEQWQRLDLYHDKPIVLQMGSRRIEGVHRGIDRSGALLLETDGVIKPFHGGEVSLRSTE